MKKNKVKISINKKRGITLLVALVVVNVLLAIGLSLSNISYKSLKLSSFGVDSQYAYYAAEAGFECAQYHDKAGAFKSPVQNKVECNGVEMNVSQIGSNVYSFTLPFLDEKYCAELQITKPKDGVTETIIEARGYNSCEASEREVRVERGIRVRKF